ncbi:unnamed protein product [Staurois parvus]|uniref:J domain-containing protein n=1 Tax=Staurois parvus TaxID=386267 RepID=A0ABN9FK16_9NEOB|nr:unnamed protein product [Staurois parvus]
MAEVRLRLFRRSAQLQIVEDVIPGGRALEAVSCVTPVVGNRQTAECSEWKRTLWPSAPRGQCMWGLGGMPQIATSGARFYSQGSGPRASFRQTGGRHGGYNNGAQESEKPLYLTHTGYYDTLEVSKNATQAQIKAAYYKQSFRFHPDRNAGNESATRLFGQVTEAYHVLGSTTLRKKYDRGILSLEDVRSARKPSGKSPSPKEAAGQRQASKATLSSSTPAKQMFDFDAFYQAHYGEQLAREKLWKERRNHIERQRKENIRSDLNNTSGMFFGLFLMSAFLLYASYMD